MNTTITLKDLSSLSGFSVSTVSKALNGKVDISKETRKAIKNIAKEHNYIPNNIAVSLRKKTSKVIAIIVPQVNQLFFSDFLFSIQKKASNLDYRLLFFQSFNDDSKVRKFLISINDGSVAGAIVLSENAQNKNTQELNFPIEFTSFNSFESEEKSKSYCIERFNDLLEKV